ncbi:MAG: discoidin domain-containing protein [Oscillospiraceae bacterium]|nr:discoidin domain-containing protein [Oscillospiraceae bacterium]
MKKLFTKTLTLLLAAAMLAGLAGCNSGSPDATPDSTPDANVSTESDSNAALPAEPAPEQPAISVTEENTYSKPLPNLPEVPYWFPNDLLSWDPAQDADAAYNVSAVPLAQRVDKAQLTPVNATQNKDMNVVAISIMNASTSGNAPHGLNTANANVFSYWQYIDKLVYWGGSSGEGLIVAPSADVIDAAHRNGVPVLGTVFFPQAGHGGKIEWLNDFLQKDANGSFPIIDKLIEAAEYFGFDGWFINQETEGGESDPNGLLTADHAALMQEFIKAFKAKAGDSLEIMWYDSMTVDGEMDWQNALTDKNKCFLIDEENNAVADSMFLNFWWTLEKYSDEIVAQMNETQREYYEKRIAALYDAPLLKSSKELAEELGIDPYDLYAGIDVQARGYNTPVDWELFAPEDQPYTSLGLYCPSWTYFAANDFFEDYQKKESVLWVNEKGDPFAATEAEEMEWKGISTYAVEQTVVSQIPFITNFNMGHGYNFFIDGERVSLKDWNNRSMQDVMPTYRWHLEQEGGNALTASIDYSDAYYGGTCVKLNGKAFKDQPTAMTLYSAQLPMTKDLSFTAKAKSTVEASMDLVVGLSDGSTETISGDQKVGAEWTSVSYDISGLDGKTVTTIGFKVSTAEDSFNLKFLLGQIAVTRSGDGAAALEASGLQVDSTSFDDDDCMYTGVRLSWTGTADHYEIYRVNQDGSISFLAATPGVNYYINGLERNDDTNKTNFQVIPVSVTGERGAASNTATMDWPDNSLPKADFKASATLAAPGQEITFESLCSANTETLAWEFPGASVETSSDASPKVSYANEGVYTVKVTAKNASGEAVAEKEGLITISSKVTGELALLSQGKDTEATAYVNDNEAPPFAVDGDVTKKWCATGNPPHAITIDLGDVKAVSEVYIAHAEAGGEGSSMNTKAYTILVSADGEEFTEVVKVAKNMLGETVDTFPVVNARYVKLSVDKPTQGSDTAARIYEIEVYGLDEAL